MAEKVLIAELEIDTGNVIKEQQELGKEITGLKTQLKEAKKSGQEYTEENIKAAAKLKTLNTQYNANQRIVTGLTTVQKGNTKTISESRLAVSALSAEWAKSAAAFGEQDKRTVKIQKELDKLNKGLKVSEKEWGNTRRNVGNYNEDIQAAISQSGLMGGKLGMLSGGLTKLKGGLRVATAGFRTLRGAIISTGIGALVIAFTSLISWFKRTEKGAQTLRVITAGLGQVVQTISDVASKLGETLFNAFSNPKEAITNLGNSIKDFILERIRLTISGIKGLGSAFKLLFEGEFKDAATAAKEAFDDINQGLNPVAIVGKKVIDTVKQGIEGIKTLSKEMQTDVAAAIELQERENELIVRKRGFQIEEIKLQQKVLGLREKASDKLSTDQERIDALAEAEKVLLDLASQREDIASKELAIQQERNELSDTSEEDLQAETDLQVALLNIENQRLAQQKAITAELSALQLGLANEAQAAALDEIELAKQTSEAKADAEKKAALDSADTQIKLEEMTSEAKIDLASQAFGNIAQIFGESSKVGKAAAIAQTTIETYKSAQSAFSAVAGIPFVGPVLGGIAAGAAIAGGIKRVQQIRAINPTSGSASPSSGGSSINIPRPSMTGSSTSLGASLGSTPSASSAEQASTMEQSFTQALASQPPVLVIEQYQEAEGRQTEVRTQSEL